MLRREVWKVNLVLVVSFALIFSLSSQVRASPRNDAGLSRISHSDFQLGEFDNLSITGSGNICLFSSEYWGNELVIESFQTGSTKLSSSEDLLSLRFTSRRPGVLVGVETRFLKSGKDMTWNFRIEEDNCGRPSGYLAWKGSQGSAFVDGSGKVKVDLNSPGNLIEGRSYHIVISPENIPEEGSYVNPHTLSVSNESPHFGLGAGENCETLISNDGGSTWKELERAPVYVLNYADGSAEGNSYYMDSYEEVYGGYLPGGDGFSVGQIIPSGFLSGSLEVVGMSVYVKPNGNPPDNLYLWICDLRNENYLIENRVIAKDTIAEGWQKVEFDPITLRVGRDYLAYLVSPGSDSENNYGVKTCKSYASGPWPELTYGGESSALVTSEATGEVDVEDGVYGLGGAIFERDEKCDLAFRFISNYETKKGIYTSPVIDASEVCEAGSVVGWGDIRWGFYTPDKTSLEVYTRSGDNKTLDSTWSSWNLASNGSDVPSPDSRYIQYQVKFHTQRQDLTPVLQNLEIRVKDVLPPIAYDLIPFRGQIVNDRFPEISAFLDDDFSGIYSDKVRMWVNGTEVLPSYDEITRRVWYRPFKPIERGNVEVKIKVTDCGGRSLVKKWNFSVRPSAEIVYHSNKNSFSEGKSVGIDYRPSCGALCLENFENSCGSEGHYYSPVIDAGENAEWRQVWWDATVPDSASLTVSVRCSGERSRWSEWKTCSNRGFMSGQEGRFLQYRVNLATSENTVTPALHEIIFVAIDMTPPSIKDIFPPRAGHTNSPSTVISAVLKDGLSGVDNSTVECELDNRIINCFRFDSENGRVYFPFISNLEDGFHNVDLRVRDKAGNFTSKSWEFKVDTCKPSFTITSPSAGEKIGGSEVTVEGTIDEPSAKVRVNEVEATVQGNHYQASVELSDGTNRLIVTASDPAGNLSRDSISVKYDSLEDILTFLKILAAFTVGPAIGLFLSPYLRKWREDEPHEHEDS